MRDPDVRAFEKSFAGRVIRAGDADYDDARAVWNRMIDTNYGDADFSLYPRRSFAKSMGYSRAMLGRAREA